jgi:Bacterial Ig-like domain (group 1)/Invasin, domain 3
MAALSTVRSKIEAFVLPLICACLFQASIAHSQVSVLSWHYDNARSSVNANESLLQPSNVYSAGFGKLFSHPVDGYVVGHPLYVPNLSIPGQGVHNVLFAATMHDSVYAYDADNASGANAVPLWKTSLLNFSAPGATPAPISIVGCGGETAWTEVGVISTPVIDSQTNTIYVVAETYENSKLVHRIHALDITTGAEKFGGPSLIAASVTVNGQTSTFQSSHQINRPALLLTNGHVYAAFGSNGCNNTNQGWILSYNTATLQLEGAFDSEPGRFYASFWQKGAGLSADSNGDIYGETGEGPVNPGVQFGSSVVKVSQVGTSLQLVDYFTPYNWQYLNQNDLDLNDGVLILPDQLGQHTHEAIAIGKEGTIYLLDRDNMGQMCTTCTTGDTQIVQELTKQVGPQTGTPVYWNNRVYFTAQHSPIQAYRMNNGLIVTPAVAQTAQLAGGGHAIITSNGTNNGVLWVINGGSLWALDANTLKILYTSAQAANGRDALGGLPHFASPIEADGKVFVGTTTSVIAYGLLPQLTPTAGNNQTAPIGTTLPIPLQVQIRDPYSGGTASGVTVTFSDGGKGGTFSNPTAVTDSTGKASTTYTFSLKAATYTLTATATGYGKGSFTETAAPGTATSLARVSGNQQTATVTTTLANLIVAVAKDANGNVVPGVSVIFTDNGAGGTFSSNPVVTNSKGQASVSYMASTKSGKVTITASAVGVPNLTFTETIVAGPATSIAVVSGNNQSAVPSTLLTNPLVVSVKDQYGNPVSGASVTFDDAGAGGSFSANPVNTLANGTASASYTTPANSGTVTVTAMISGVAGSATFTVTVQ